MKNNFSKAERLHKKTLIKELFKKGSYFYLPPFKVIVLATDQIPLTQILISIPKKNFKRAVDRNMLKRRTVEAYRLNKKLIFNSEKYLLGFIYTEKYKLPYKNIEIAIVSALNRLSAKEYQYKKNN